MNKLWKLLADNRGATRRRFDVQTKAGGGESEIFLYDAIVSSEAEAEWFGGVAPEPFAKALRAIKHDVIHLRVDSPGGVVFGGRAIEQALREHPARVVAHVDGLAASAASFVIMAADEIVMSQGGFVMIHKGWTFTLGNEDEHLATAALLNKVDGTLVRTYADRTKADPAQIAQWMAAETWFTSDEAVQHGFADSVAGGNSAKAQSGWNLSAYAHAPHIEFEPPEALPAASAPHRIDPGPLLRGIDMSERLPA